MAYYFVVLINLPNDTYLVSLFGLPLNLPFNLQQECQFWNSHLDIERYVLVALKMTHVCFCVGAKARGPCQKSSSIILHFIFWDRVYTDPNTICLNWLNRKQLGYSCPFSQCWNYWCSFPCLALYMNTHWANSPALDFSPSPIPYIFK